MDVKLIFVKREENRLVLGDEIVRPKQYFEVDIRGCPEMAEEAVQAVRTVAKNWKEWEEI